jgi:hypothetical protein
VRSYFIGKNKYIILSRKKFGYLLPPVEAGGIIASGDTMVPFVLKRSISWSSSGDFNDLKYLLRPIL